MPHEPDRQHDVRGLGIGGSVAEPRMVDAQIPVHGGASELEAEGCGKGRFAPCGVGAFVGRAVFPAHGKDVVVPQVRDDAGGERDAGQRQPGRDEVQGIVEPGRERAETDVFFVFLAI